MTITQLEYLIAVVNNGSFSAAAERCFVTQPSLSTQIKNLEEELGVVILNRNEKPITTTKAGEVIVEQALKALAECYAIKERVDEMSSKTKGSLVLAVIPTISPYILHKFVPQFAKSNPNVKLEIREMYTHQIEAGLRKGVVDIGLLAGGITSPSHIKEERLYDDKLYLYVAKSNPLYGKREVKIEDINTDELLLLPDGHCLRTQVLNLCEGRVAHSGHVFFESGSLDTITRMVDSSGALTIIPQMMVPFISKEKKNNIIPFNEGVGAKREISLAVSNNFYKKKIYDVLKKTIIEATELDRLL